MNSPGRPGYQEKKARRGGGNLLLEAKGGRVPALKTLKRNSDREKPLSQERSWRKFALVVGPDEGSILRETFLAIIVRK